VHSDDPSSTGRLHSIHPGGRSCTAVPPDEEKEERHLPDIIEVMLTHFILPPWAGIPDGVESNAG